MPITLKIIPENNLIISTHVGEISDNEFLDFYWQVFKANTFDPTKKALIDLRKTDSKQRSTDTLRQFADLVKGHLKNSSLPAKIAIVAPKALTFGLARMYQAYTDTVTWDLAVFHDIDAAFAWLKVPEDIIGENS